MWCQYNKRHGQKHPSHGGRPIKQQLRDQWKQQASGDLDHDHDGDTLCRHGNTALDKQTVKGATSIMIMMSALFVDMATLL